MAERDVIHTDQLTEQQSSSSESPFRLLLIALLVASSYYLGSWVGFTLTFPNSAVSTLWPPNAILFCALLLTPAQRWWIILISVFPAHLLVQMQSGVPLLMNLSWFISNSIEALIGAFCLRSVVERKADFSGFRHVAIYFGVAILAPFLSSFIDAYFVTLFGWKGNTYWQTWVTRLRSNVVTAFVIPPLFILSLDHGIAWLRSFSRERCVEGAALTIGLLTVSVLVFCRNTVGSGAMTALIYLPLPFLLWAAARFGQLGASAAFMLVVATSISGAFAGSGPFNSHSPATNVLALQLFLIATYIPMMFLAVYIEEHHNQWNPAHRSERRERTAAVSPILARFESSLAALAICGACYLSSLLGLALLFPASHFSAIWPPSAVLLACLLIYPRRRWPLVLLVGAVAHFAAHLHFGTSLAALSLYYFFDCVLVLLTATALIGFGGHSFDLSNLRRAMIFVAVTTAATGLMASIWIVSVNLIGAGGVDWLGEWRRVFLSNLLPFLILIPGIVLGSIRAAEITKRASFNCFAEAIVLAAGLLVCGVGIFSLRSETLLNFPALFYLPVPFLLWAAVRFGAIGLSASFLTFALMAILNAQAGHGPFVTQSDADNIFWLQVSLIVVYVPLLLLASLAEERQDNVQLLSETQNRFRHLADSAPIMIWLSGTDKLCTFFSKGWLDFTGRTIDQELGSGWSEAVHPEDFDRCLRIYNESFDSRREFAMEYRLRRFDGEYRWIIDKGAPRVDPQGAFLGYMGSAVDISERVHTENALKQSQAQVRLFVEHTPAAVAMFDREMRYVMTSRRWLTDYNLGEQNLIGRSHYEVFTEVPRRWKEIHRNCLSGAVENCQEDLLRRLDGSIEWIRWEVRPWYVSSGAVGGIIMFTEVISERKRAESRLHAQHAITRILSEANSFAEAAPHLLESICELLDWQTGEIWRLDGESDVLRCLETWHRPSETLAKFASRSRRDTLSRGAGLPGRIWSDGKPAWISDVTIDRNFHRSSLTIKAGLHSAFGFPVLVGNEILAVLAFFSHDVREQDQDLVELMTSIGSQIGQFVKRKRAEEALRESEARLQLGMEVARFGYWEVELSTGETIRSPTFEHMLGFAPGTMANKRDDFFALIHPEDRKIPLEQINRCIETLETLDMEYRIVRPDGSIRWLASRGQAMPGAGRPVGRVVGMSADITERKRVEEELKKALAEVQRLKDRLEAENVYLRSEVSGSHRHGKIIGGSDGIKKVLEQLDRVARTEMTVLVLGETGTGKELVARLVHEKSGRREQPLVKVNCSALPADLIESELFGHERGAFTGATTKQVGRFELADRGTIFLDEVGDLPVRLQPKLLRVLQEGEFERLGSGKTLKVDVRVIAATNRNLTEAVQRGRFRADLYYRLNVYPIEVLPLRDRIEDIGLLAEVFLQEAGRRLGKSFGNISREVIEALEEYGWPGNVRELENVIERGAVTSYDSTLQLPEGWNQAPIAVAGIVSGFSGERHMKTTVPSGTLEEVERSRIRDVLHQTNWRIEGPKGAALILGMHPNTLRSRMHKLEIQRPVR